VEKANTIFDLMLNKNLNNLLLKSGISLDNPFSYVIIIDTDNLINDQLKKFDFRKVYKKTPTQVERKAEDIDNSIPGNNIVEVSDY
jgi:hypothetical protein